MARLEALACAVSARRADTGGGCFWLRKCSNKVSGIESTHAATNCICTGDKLGEPSAAVREAEVGSAVVAGRRGVLMASPEVIAPTRSSSADVPHQIGCGPLNLTAAPLVPVLAWAHKNGVGNVGNRSLRNSAASVMLGDVLVVGVADSIKTRSIGVGQAVATGAPVGWVSVETDLVAGVREDALVLDVRLKPVGPVGLIATSKGGDDDKVVVVVAGIQQVRRGQLLELVEVVGLFCG
jgi:hypothetical protein